MRGLALLLLPSAAALQPCLLERVARRTHAPCMCARSGPDNTAETDEERLTRLRAEWEKEAEWAGSEGPGSGRSGKRLHARMLAFDFVGSSDEAVARCAASVFSMMRREAAELISNPLTSALASRCVLKHSDLSSALASILATKVKYADLPGAFQNAGGAREELAAHEVALFNTFAEVLAQPDVLRAITADLVKCYIVDPAADGVLQPALFFKGFHALTVYRVAHALWETGSPASKGAALMLQSRACELFAVDIHPGAKIGNGVMLDHATGVVVGGTAILGNDLYILHQVTLGATGKDTGGKKRHPTVGNGAVLGAGSTVLGDVYVGIGATVGAGAIVTKDVPDRGTVVGVNKLVERKVRTSASKKQPEYFPANNIHKLAREGNQDDFTWMYNDDFAI